MLERYIENYFFNKLRNADYLTIMVEQLFKRIDYQQHVC